MSLNSPPLNSSPPATGARLQWRPLPSPIRAAVEDWLGSRIVSAVTQPTGFSPGVAARLRTAGGRRVFVKAVGPEPNPTCREVHRREARIVSQLPKTAPVPRLLWSYDEGDDGWVLLLFEDVEGRHPQEPWQDEELNRVLATLRQLADLLTPAGRTAAAVSRGPAGRSGRHHGRAGLPRRLLHGGRAAATAARPADPPCLPGCPGRRRPPLARAADRVDVSRALRAIKHDRLYQKQEGAR